MLYFQKYTPKILLHGNIGLLNHKRGRIGVAAQMSEHYSHSESHLLSGSNLLLKQKSLHSSSCREHGITVARALVQWTVQPTSSKIFLFGKVHFKGRQQQDNCVYRVASYVIYYSYKLWLEARHCFCSCVWPKAQGFMFWRDEVSMTL